MVYTEVGEIVICPVDQRKRNMSAVVKHLTQRKNVKHTKRRCIRNLVANSLTNRTSNLILPFFVTSKLLCSMKILFPQDLAKSFWFLGELDKARCYIS